ncbi:MAG: response regulator [Sciscionella sp.]
MIRTLVVDDDYLVAEIHSAYVDRLDDFSSLSPAHSAQEALDTVERHRPDLLLLDLYLPDQPGLELLRTLRAPDLPLVDVIVITAAQDTASVRTAMQLGALHYLVKPFTQASLTERLLSYSGMKKSLTSMSSAGQPEIDRLYGILRSSWRNLPKGQSDETLELVLGALRDAGDDLSAAEVAEKSRISRATAQRYLSHLAHIDRVHMALRYGSTGRPEHRYRWKD